MAAQPSPFSILRAEPVDPADQLRYLLERNRDLQEQVNALLEIVTRVNHVAPTRPALGRLAFADGINWNPGGGAAWYFWNGTSWTHT